MYVIKFRDKYYNGSLHVRHRMNPGIDNKYYKNNGLCDNIEDARELVNLTTAKSSLTKIRNSLCNTEEEASEWYIVKFKRVEECRVDY